MVELQQDNIFFFFVPVLTLSGMKLNAKQ